MTATVGQRGQNVNAGASGGGSQEDAQPLLPVPQPVPQTGIDGGHRPASCISPIDKVLSIRLLWGVTFPSPP